MRSYEGKRFSSFSNVMPAERRRVEGSVLGDTLNGINEYLTTYDQIDANAMEDRDSQARDVIESTLAQTDTAFIAYARDLYPEAAGR